MNQTMNIFRKDVRYLRLELLASLTLMAVLDLLVPKCWTSWPVGSQPPWIAVQTLTFLLFAAWMVLIVRLVHGERLAGLNQFWTTRPYEWTKLLMAKLVFLLLFVYAPLLLSQFYLLHRGGFAVGPDLGTLLHNLLLLTSSYVLPIACIAVVTTSFAQTVLSLLGIAAGFAGVYTAMVFLGAASATLGVPRYYPMFAVPLEIAIWMVLLMAALLVQYGRRETKKSIVLLASAVVLVSVTGMTLEGSAAAAAGYAAVADVPASVSVNAGGPRDFTLELPRNPRTAVYRVPETFSNVAPGTNFLRQAERYRFTAADGYTWTSNWRMDFGLLVPKGADNFIRTRSFIDIPWNVHDRLMGGPVTLRMEYLVAQVQNEESYTIPVSSDDQAIPGLGYCAAVGEDHYLLCRSTYKWGDYFAYATFASRGPCGNPPAAAPDPLSDAAPPGLVRAGSYIERIGFASPIPMFTPVDVNQAYLGTADREGRICLGYPGTFTRKHIERRVRLETQTATVVLKDGGE